MQGEGVGGDVDWCGDAAIVNVGDGEGGGDGDADGDDDIAGMYRGCEVCIIHTHALR